MKATYIKIKILFQRNIFDTLLSGELASPNALSKKINDNHKDLDKRVSLIEKEQTAKDYFVKTAVGLGVIILLKFVFDWFAYDIGFKKGLDAKRQEYTVDSSINVLLSQKKNLTIEIDSLAKAKDSINN